MTKRKSKKGKPMGRLIIGVKEKRGGMTVITKVEEKEEAVMAVEIWVSEEKWRIVGVYAKKNMEKKLEVMKEWLEQQEEDTWTIIRGISTQRQGRWEGGRGGGLEEEIGRRSKDGKINGEERKFVGELEKVGWGILNVSIDGDEREFTYMGGREESVIDYVVRQIKVRERMLKMERGTVWSRIITR